VNPVVNPALSADGVLTFENAAIKAGAATPNASYALRWSRFDNTADTHEPIGAEVVVNDMRAEAPADLVRAGDYVAVTIVSRHAEHPAWAQPLTAYFRREGAGWKTVGLTRE
jgi:hypothetical protein